MNREGSALVRIRSLTQFAVKPPPLPLRALEEMQDRLLTVDRWPRALRCAQGDGEALEALRAALARDGVALTGEPETWAPQVQAARIAEHQRVHARLDAAEQSQELATN